MNQFPVHTEKVIDAQTITAGSSYTSTPINFRDYLQTFPARTGIFSLYFTVTGSGTCKFQYKASIAGNTSLVPTIAANIADGITVASGPGGDGTRAESLELNVQVVSDQWNTIQPQESRNADVPRGQGIDRVTFQVLER